MQLRWLLRGTVLLGILTDPQDVPVVGDVCVLPLGDQGTRVRVVRRTCTYSFARALMGIDRLQLESIDLDLEEDGADAP